MNRYKLLLVLFFCFAIFGCNGYNSINLTIVNKIPRGSFAGEEMPYNIGWYEIGLSRNGKEPIEYIWRVGHDYDSFIIFSSEIGEKGTVHLNKRAKQEGIKIPLPDTKDPHIFYSSEVYWVKKE
jgi:hypothetical protein